MITCRKARTPAFTCKTEVALQPEAGFFQKVNDQFTSQTGILNILAQCGVSISTCPISHSFVMHPPASFAAGLPIMLPIHPFPNTAKDTLQSQLEPRTRDARKQGAQHHRAHHRRLLLRCDLGGAREYRVRCPELELPVVQSSAIILFPSSMHVRAGTHSHSSPNSYSPYNSSNPSTSHYFAYDYDAASARGPPTGRPTHPESPPRSAHYGSPGDPSYPLARASRHRTTCARARRATNDACAARTPPLPCACACARRARRARDSRLAGP